MTTRRALGRRSAGYTLVELLLATASASVLVVGLTSSLYVASRALDLDDSAVVERTRDGRALAQMMEDIGEALAFSERAPTAITFTVPDRTGDGVPDEIRYATTGSYGTELTYTFNGSTTTLVDGLQGVTFDFATRTIEAAEVVAGEKSGFVVFEELTETPQSSAAESITLTTPPATAEGDLLIAAVALDGLVEPADPAGWNRLNVGVDSGDDVTLGVWWKLAGASEAATHAIAWTGGQQAYGWVMRFTGHDAASPIHAFATDEGKSTTPNSPAVDTTVRYCLILRLGGFDDDDINAGDAGVGDHTTICSAASGSGSGTVSGAAAYTTLTDAGSSDASEFTLDKSEDYRTLTIAIAPSVSLTAD